MINCDILWILCTLFIRYSSHSFLLFKKKWTIKFVLYLFWVSECLRYYKKKKKKKFVTDLFIINDIFMCECKTHLRFKNLRTILHCMKTLIFLRIVIVFFIIRCAFNHHKFKYHYQLLRLLSYSICFAALLKIIRE